MHLALDYPLKLADLSERVRQPRDFLRLKSVLRQVDHSRNQAPAEGTTSFQPDFFSSRLKLHLAAGTDLRILFRLQRLLAADDDVTVRKHLGGVIGVEIPKSALKVSDRGFHL